MPDIADLVDSITSPPAQADPELQLLPSTTKIGGLVDSLQANPSIGHPAWSDQEIPVEKRIEHFVNTRAQQPRPWEETVGEVQRLFPGINPEAIKPHLEQAAGMEAARAHFKDTEYNPWSILRNMIPISSSLAELSENSTVKKAMDRVKAGKADDGDFYTVAEWERKNQVRANLPLGPAIGEGLSHIPAIVGEAALAGGALKGLGLAGEAGAASTRLQSLGRLTATTAAMPSMYLPEASQRAIVNGGEWYHFKNFAPAFALGEMQVLVFGSLSKYAGGGLPGYIQRIGIGMGEQQLIDAAADLTHLREGGGIMGELMAGKGEEAGKHAVVQLATFAVFSAMHRSANPQKIVRDFTEAAQSLKRSGLSEQAVGRELIQVGETLTEALKENPQLTREEAKTLFDNEPIKPVKEAGKALADAIPVEGVKPPEKPAGQPRPEPMTPEQASAALEKETARQQLEGRNASRRPEAEAPPAPADPLEAATHDQVRALAKSLGLASAGSRDVVLKRLTDKIGEPTTRHFLEQAMAPAEAPKPIQPIPRPEEAQHWKDTGTQFVEKPEGPTTFNGRDGAEYRMEAHVEVAPEHVSEHAGQKRARVRAYDAKGEEVGHVDFYQTKEGAWRGEGLKVTEAYRGKGIAEALYDFLAAHGEKILPAEGRTPEGKRFWERNREATARPPAAPPVSAAPEAAPVPVVASEPSLRGERITVEDLKQRYEEGEPVSLSEVMNAAKLSAKQRHVLEQRLQGRSFEEIANDAEMRKGGGGAYKRQRIEQMETEAMARLGVHSSLAKAVHEGQKIDQALEMAADGKTVSAADLHGDPEVVAKKIRNKLTREERAHEEAVRAFLEEAERAKRQGASASLLREADAISQEGTPVETARREPENAPAPVPEGNPPPGEGAQGRAAGPRNAPSEGAPAGGRATAGHQAPRVEEYIPPPTMPERKKSHTDFGYQEKVLREEGTHTVAREIQHQGGIDPATIPTDYRETLTPEEFKYITRHEDGTKGKVPLDVMAQMLVHLTGQEGTEARTGGGIEWMVNAVKGHHPIHGESELTVGRRQQQQAHEEWRQKAIDYFEQFYPDRDKAEAALRHWIKSKAEPAMRKRVLASEKLQEEDVHGENQELRKAGEKPLTAEELAEVEAEARQQVEDEARAAEHAASGKSEELGPETEVAPGVYFHTPGAGSPAGPGGGAGPGPGAGRAGVGPFEINATIDKLLDVAHYIEGKVPFGAPAAAMTREQGVVTGKQAAGDPRIHLEEAAHLLSPRLGLETNPALLPPDVGKGFQQFYPSLPLSKRAVMEGFAEWMVRRVSGELSGLTPEQQKASAFAEKLIGQKKGLPEILDRLGGMFAELKGQTATQQAAGQMSPTGQIAQPQQTAGERVAGWWDRLKSWADDAITNNLAVLKRAGMERAYKVWSRLMFADKDLANRFTKEGIGTIQDGKWTVVGPNDAKIRESLQEADLAPIGEVPGGWWQKLKASWQSPEKVSKASLWAMARHVLDEAAQERPVVPEEQRALYEQAYKELSADSAFVARATAFADRLTEAHNAGLRALASPEIHRLSPEVVSSLIEKRPTYLPTTRIREDRDWTRFGGNKGEKQAAVLFERSGSGEQIMDPLLSYEVKKRMVANQLNEQIRRNAVAEYLLQPEMAKWGLMNPEPTGEVAGDAYQVKELWDRDGKKGTYYWYGPDGTLQNFRIHDKALYDLVTGQQGDGNSVAQFFRWMGKLGFDTPLGRFEPLSQSAGAVRKLATAASLGFQVRNISPARDPYEFLKNTVDQTSAARLPEMYKRTYAFEWSLLRGEIPTDTVFHLFARERGREQRQFAFETPGVETARSKAEILKQALNVAGAGELAPRFLEFTNRLKQLGWTEARLESEIKDAQASARSGKQYQDPIPWDVLQDAMEAANEVTVPFSRQGYVTREINKLAPFFGPAVAGMSKQMRNWRDNPQGAALALGGFLTLRMMHWLAFSDEDWHKELSAHDRYTNFVVPVGGKLWRVPGARDLEVPAGGALLATLDAITAKNPDFKGLVKESMGAVLPPSPEPPPVKVGRELLTNKNWMGTPIVPGRAEHMPGGENFIKYQAPYAAEQLTGGRLKIQGDVGESLGKSATSALMPFTEVRNARRSVDEFYEKLKDLDAERNSSRRKGLAFEEEGRYQLLHRVQTRLQQLTREMRGERLVGKKTVRGDEPDADRKAEIRQMQVQLARQALQALDAR